MDLDLLGDTPQGPGIAPAAIAVSLIRMLAAPGGLTPDEVAAVLRDARAGFHGDDRKAVKDAVPSTGYPPPL